jgi:hypothetical protein
VPLPVDVQVGEGMPLRQFEPVCINVLGAWPTHVVASRYDLLHQLVLLAKVQVVPICGFATRHTHAVVEHGRQSLVEEAVGLQLNAKVRALDVPGPSTCRETRCGYRVH